MVGDYNFLPDKTNILTCIEILGTIYKLRNSLLGHGGSLKDNIASGEILIGFNNWIYKERKATLTFILFPKVSCLKLNSVWVYSRKN